MTSPRTTSFVLALLALLAPGVASAQGPLLDINQDTNERSSFPEAFTETDDGWIYFYAVPTWNGFVTTDKQLHRTLGTAATTELVVDLGIGVLDGFEPLHAVGNLVFFAPRDPDVGQELWVSDGSDEGTFLLKDIVPGSGSSSPEQLIEFNGQLYFVANDEELWTSDGTQGGTTLIRAFPGFLTPGIEWLTVGHDALYFSVSGDLGDRELWRSDGTIAGTLSVTPGNDLDVEQITPGDDRVYFYARRLGTLWVSDGTVGGTTEIGTIDAHWPSTWATLGNVLLFGTDSNQLWRSDGTPLGTTLLKDFGPASFFPGDMLRVGTQVFLTAPGFQAGQDLYVTDGTVSGTERLTTDRGPSELVSMNGQLYFAALEPEFLREVWTSDGTPGGTFRVTDLHPDGIGVAGELFVSETKGEIYFSGADGVLGAELWKTDGVASQTLVADIQEGTGDADPEYFDRIGDVTFFLADDGIHGQELWRTDGTSAGTYMVKDVNGVHTGSFNGNPFGRSARLGGQLIFRASNGLWRTDGTTEGTELLAAVTPFSLKAYRGRVYYGTSDGIGATDGTPEGTGIVVPGSASFNWIETFQDRLYFTMADATHGVELWKLDETLDGATLVIDLNPGPANASPFYGGEAGGYLVFGATHPSSGTELWRTDGTEAGTSLVMDIAPGSGSGLQGRFYSLGNGTIAFMGDTLASGRELWRTDGTTAGTYMVRDIDPGPGDGAWLQVVFSYERRAAPVAGRHVFFSAKAPGTDWEPWLSDGTPEGTRLVPAFDPTGGGTWQDFLSVGQSRIYFPVGATGGASLPEDGEQTELQWVDRTGRFGGWLDLRPGPRSSYPVPFGVLGDKVLVSALDDYAGRELFLVDAGPGIEPVGVGCGELVQPELRSLRPELGRNWQITATGGAAGAPAVLWIGAPLAPITLPGVSCEGFVGPDAEAHPGAADASGAVTWSVPIADDPALIGMHLVLQVAYLPSPGDPGGLTNGLYATLGEHTPDWRERRLATAPSGGPAGL